MKVASNEWGSVNRSMPPGVIIPVLSYRDVGEAVVWLCRAFGFVERLRIGDHRSQLSFNGGSVVVARLQSEPRPSSVDNSDLHASLPSSPSHSIMVRVSDVDHHYTNAEQAGARILGQLTTYPYGERQYSVKDLGGHLWTFTQTVADVDPADWSGALIKLGQDARSRSASEDVEGRQWRFEERSIDWIELSNLYRIAPLGDKKPDDLKLSFSSSRYKCFVFDDGVLIGAGRALADGVDCSYLCDVAVHPDFQGHGLGKAIIEKLKELSAGHRKIILYANPGKEGFYKKLGFMRMRTAMAIFKNQNQAVNSGLVEDP